MSPSIRFGRAPCACYRVEEPQEWRWPGVHALLSARDDGITAVAPILERQPRFAELVEKGLDPEAFARLRRAKSIEHPPGDDRFITRLDALTRRSLRPGKRGPKPSNNREPGQEIKCTVTVIDRNCRPALRRHERPMLRVPSMPYAMADLKKAFTFRNTASIMPSGIREHTGSLTSGFLSSLLGTRLGVGTMSGQSMPITIESTDYWFKVTGMLQQNWALIEQNRDDEECTVFFLVGSHASSSKVFDKLAFPSARQAEETLRRNGFRRFSEDREARFHITPPKPPYVEANRPIYSSGEYWHKIQN
jgi:hypothetical protein